MTTSARNESARLSDLLRREHHALGEFLVALADFDRRRVWVELGHASLFSYLRRELHLSAGAAQYRKMAAELVQRFPQVEVALRDGRLCLSSVIELAKVITPENASDLLPRFFGLSSRDAAFVAASIRPVENHPMREFIVAPLRSGAASEAPETTSAVHAGSFPFRAPETALGNAAEGASPIGSAAPRPEVVAAARPRVKPLDAERARVHMTVSRSLLEKLEAARAALSHSHPGASADQIFEVGLDLILERQAKRRGVVKNPRKKADPKATTAPPAPAPAPATATATATASAPATPTVAAAVTSTATPPPPRARTRYIPADVRRAVWERDGGRCQFRLPSGEVCGSDHQPEFHHLDAFARGGEATVEKLEIRCKPHNDVEARRVFGDAWMDRFTGAGVPPAP
jgi:hypothetical protein